MKDRLVYNINLFFFEREGIKTFRCRACIFTGGFLIDFGSSNIHSKILGHCLVPISSGLKMLEVGCQRFVHLN